MQDYYYRLMKQWAFTKNGKEYPQYGIGGLGYRSNYTLKTVSNMKVGDSISIHGYTLKRIEDRTV